LAWLVLSPAGVPSSFASPRRRAIRGGPTTKRRPKKPRQRSSAKGLNSVTWLLARCCRGQRRQGETASGASSVTGTSESERVRVWGVRQAQAYSGVLRALCRGLSSQEGGSSSVRLSARRMADHRRPAEHTRLWGWECSVWPVRFRCRFFFFFFHAESARVRAPAAAVTIVAKARSACTAMISSALEVALLSAAASRGLTLAWRIRARADAAQKNQRGENAAPPPEAGYDA